MASQAPATAGGRAATRDYRKAWLAVNSLLNDGRSWSGHERNCCYLNIGTRRWVDVSAITGLDLADDARAVCASDWDHDGDLDLWISNRNGPRARFLRNDVPSGNRWIALQLVGVRCNRDAIGARVTVQLSGANGRSLRRTIYAGDAFVSQSSRRLHFGLGPQATIERLTVRWPDGQVEDFGAVDVDAAYRVEQGSGQAEPLPGVARAVSLLPSSPQLPEATAKARIPIASSLWLPRIDFETFAGQRASVPEADSGATLIALWSRSCRPCLAELSALKREADRLRAAGVNVVALCVDAADGESTAAARQHMEKLGFPFRAGWADGDTLDKLEAVHRTVLDMQRPLPLPASFLIDSDGRLIAIYKGPASVEQVCQDAPAEKLDVEARRAWAAAFDSRWSTRPAMLDSIEIAYTLFNGGFNAATREYLKQLDEVATERRKGYERLDHAEVLYFRGAMRRAEKKLDEALDFWQRAIAVAPAHVRANRDLAQVYFARGQYSESARRWQALVAAAPGDTVARNEWARSLQRAGDVTGAVQQWRETLRRDPSRAEAANSLAWILATHPDDAIAAPEEAIRWARVACEETANRSPQALRTLSAALARGGDFAAAIEVAERSLALDQAAGAAQSAALTESALARYRQGTALIVPQQDASR
ncbi:MAG: hypothetical protein DWQ42_13495 [Planctomycetota bacterium]|nr:MAG: hypothetical protein DWQ42_13495 [Planctomycetota bacterium]REK40798.1 MAG: hypothetical protein DWQ46_15335 [Planctomycetota bacterium]